MGSYVERQQRNIWLIGLGLSLGLGHYIVDQVHPNISKEAVEFCY